MDQITPEEWEAAKRHFDEVFEEYKKLLGQPGVNTSLAIMLGFDPLLRRYNSGERTPELYQEMLSVE